MSRGRIGIKKTNSDTEATGIWNLTEQQQLKVITNGLNQN